MSQDAAQWTLLVGIGAWVAWHHASIRGHSMTREKNAWLALQLEVTSVLEKLSTWAARQAKRETKAAIDALEAATDVIVHEPVGAERPTQHRKAHLWARARNLAESGRISDTARARLASVTPGSASSRSGASGNGDDSQRKDGE